MSNVTLRNDQKTFQIDNLIIEDARAHRVLSLESPQSIEQKLRDALAIGFLAIDRTAAMVESDWVIQRLEGQIAAVNFALDRRSQEVMDTIRNQLDPARAGSLLAPVTDLVQRTQSELNTRLSETMSAINDSHAKLGRTLDDTFDPESRTSRIQQFANQMAATITKLECSIDPKKEGTLLQGFLGRFEMLSRELASSPLLDAKFNELRDEVKAMVTAMKVGAEAEQAISDAKEAAINASPAKGFVFEEEVRSELKHIAEIRNDLVESVGSSPGKGTSKKGDFVYFLHSLKARIVLELKDFGSSRFTFDKIRDLMAESRNNRDAIFGIFLVRDKSCLPDGIGRFFIGDDFLIATHEFLEVAMKVSILMTHQRVAKMGAGDGLDLLSIEMNIEEVRQSVEQLSDLESHCATAQKAVTKTADGIRRISHSLTEKVEGLLSKISKAKAD